MRVISNLTTCSHIHVGMPKAVVAAERIRLIGMRKEERGVRSSIMHVHPLTMRMDDSAASQEVFSHQFWKQVDVVLTALVSLIIISK